MSLAALLAGDLCPAPRPDIVDWAHTLNIPFEVSKSRPGPYRTSAHPYIPDILRAIAAPETRMITAVIGSQGAKTLTGTLGILYLIVIADGGDALIALPKMDLSRSFSEKRFQPIVDFNRSIAALKPADLDHWKNLELTFPRGVVALGSTASVADLVSRPCRIVWIDEARLAAPGTIYEAEERSKTFPYTRKILVTGTPGETNGEPWTRYLTGTQETFHIPCPHCQRPFAFENFPEDRPAPQRPGLAWSPDAKKDGLWSEDLVRQSAHYRCPHCLGTLTEEQRMPLLTPARYHAANPGAGPTHRSFNVPSLCSPDVSFGEMAWQFLRAKDDFFLLERFIRGYWAIPFDPPTTKITDTAVDACRSRDYRTGQLPVVPRFLALCADWGERMTHYSIAAHTDLGDLYIIEAGTVLAPKDLLKIIRDRTFTDPAGAEHRISRGLVDAGDCADLIYAVCDQSDGILYPSKGSGAGFGTVTWGPVKAYPDLLLYTYIDHTAKRSLYLHTIAGRRPPLLHFPLDASPDFLHGHTGQQLIEERTAQGTRRVFKKIAWDHYGDCTKLHRVIDWAVGTTAAEEGEESSNKP